MNSTLRRVVPGLALFLGLAGSAAAAGLSVDLNRLETHEGRCRATLVVVNPVSATAESLKADLVVFGSDGVVGRRLAVELGPVASGKTVVRMFDIPGTACENVGSILLNDVPQCRFAGDDKASSACLADLTTSSRAGTVRFFK